MMDDDNAFELAFLFLRYQEAGNDGVAFLAWR